MFWLPTVTVGDPAAKRQLPFGSAARVKEQGDDHSGSEPNRCVPSWQRTFRSAHQRETLPKSIVLDGMGRQERRMRALRVAASSALSG